MNKTAHWALVVATLILFLTASPLGAKNKSKGVTTSLQDIMILMDLTSSIQDESKIYIDDENCQCVCSDEQWACVDTTCEMQEQACFNDVLTIERVPWHTDAPTT